MRTKQTKVLCPECGAEYLPGELFLPNYFLGQPLDIIKDYNYKILEYDGIKQDTKTTYTCDKCGCKFNIFADIKYHTVKKDQ